MANYSSFDDFYSEYNKPSVNNIIVGFSGIDPNRKTGAGGVSEEDIANGILNFFVNQRIVIDCNG